MICTRDDLKDFARYVLETAEDPMTPAYAQLAQEYEDGKVKMGTILKIRPDAQKIIIRKKLDAIADALAI